MNIDSKSNCKKDNSIFREFNAIRKEAKIKECFYFDHSNCSKEIIKAHTVQNNKILNKLSRNGMVIALDESSLPNIQLKEIGRGVASVFYGFCKHHDMEIFKDIDLNNYQNTPIQNFLYAYRGFAKCCHSKLEKKQMFILCNEKLSSNNRCITDICIDGLDNALSIDFEFINDRFKNGFISKDYSELVTKHITLDYECKFAVATVLSPVYDLNGKKINNLFDNSKPVNMLCFNVFPENGKTYIIFSWFKYANNIYRNFFYKLLTLTQQQKINFLNQFIPLETENIYINPELWDSWTENAKEMFYNFFNSPNFIQKIDYNKETSFDLFSK